MPRTIPLVLALCAFACGESVAGESAVDDEEVRARSRWNVNDVSFLFPFPGQGEAEGQKLLGMKTTVEGRDKVLLPEDVFKLLGDQAAGAPFLIEAPGRDQLWPKLRVTAVRVDPCFDAHEPRTEAHCVRQLRLTAQPVIAHGAGRDATHEIFDASIHLFYPLDDGQFVALMRGLRDLKRANSGNAALGVHPVMKREGLGGPFTTKLKELVLEACDAARLTKMTFMATGRSGNNWFWGALEKNQDGKFVMVPIATRPLEEKEDAFHQNGRAEHDGTSLHSPLFPDELLKSETIAVLSQAKIDAAFDKLQRIANPKELGTNEVSCATCHVSNMTLVHAAKKRGLDRPPTTPKTFVPPAGQNAAFPTNEIAGDGRNMHAFSWFNEEAIVSARTANESARIADFIGTEDFTRSLSEPARAEWTRR